MSKKSNLTVTLIGVGVIAVALTVVLSALFAPRTAANKAFRTYRNALSEQPSFSYVSVYSPLDHSGPLLPTESEVRLTEPEEIEELRTTLLRFTEGARYGGIEEAVSGNWDVRVRFASEGGVLDLYIGEDRVYLSRDGRQYIFLPREAEEYTAWRAAWIGTLFTAEE